MQQTTLTFPNLQLNRRDAHKMRGYFANLFGQDSDLFHNHQEDGRAIYRYSLIQYKVVDQTPMLVGLEKGSELLNERFLKLKELIINEKAYELQQKNIKSETIEIGITNSLQEYKWMNLWIPFNQLNHKKFLNADSREQKEMMRKILIGNCLSFFKGVGSHIESQIMIQLRDMKSKPLNFKNQKFIGFEGSFTTNTLLPDYIGLGKSVSRGFGTIKKIS